MDAVVTNVAPLEVTLIGASQGSPAKRLASYTPVLNDKVDVVQRGSSLLVQGKVIG